MIFVTLTSVTDLLNLHQTKNTQWKQFIIHTQFWADPEEHQIPVWSRKLNP